MKQLSATAEGDNNCSFFQAAIIDENGREIPITEAMILQALQDFQAGEHPFFPNFKEAKTSPIKSHP